MCAVPFISSVHSEMTDYVKIFRILQVILVNFRPITVPIYFSSYTCVRSGCMAFVDNTFAYFFVTFKVNSACILYM